MVEADESDGTFTKLPATIAVVTNIDPEHLDHYGDFDTLKAAFAKFVQNIPFYGFATMCIDNAEVQAFARQRGVQFPLFAKTDVNGASAHPVK